MSGEFNDEYVKELEDALAEKEREIKKLIDKAADFIGTEKDLLSIVCIDVALDHAATLRREWEAALQRIATLTARVRELEKLTSWGGGGGGGGGGGTGWGGGGGGAG
jgi:uncharacterized membrane protein YgcG